MNKKLISGGILVGVIIGLVLLLKPKASPVKNQSTFEKEINVGQDICGEFSGEWVESVLNKEVVRAEGLDSNGTYVCQYYFKDNSFVTLRLSNVSYENQKKGQQSLKRSISKNNAITLNHFVAVQENNIINDIVFEINPNLILTVDRSSTKALSEVEIISFAVKVSERIQKHENNELISTITSSPSTSSLEEKEIINNFFQLIEEGKADDAVMMMSSATISDDGIKQSFGVQFNAMNTVKVKKIEEVMREEWTEVEHEYMVTLDVVMNPNSANNPIPYYGYERGENIRFISLIKENGLWKVDSIGTGP